MVKLIHVVGARPNFMKLSPVYNALEKYDVEQLIVHTGQHYDHNMSGVFFEQLGINHPTYNLGVGSHSHAVQTAKIMIEFEKVLLKENPAAVIVYGDINSTLAAVLVAVKLGIKTVHVEAGLRSFDRGMPEEINRLATDCLCDLLLAPSEDAVKHLKAEGVDENKIVTIGNVMIDTLCRLLPQSTTLPHNIKLIERYALVTLHRPSNVDDDDFLMSFYKRLTKLSQKIQVVFSIHPRTAKKLKSLKVSSSTDTIVVLPPCGYTEFLALQKGASAIVTDSGGLQEESTYLKIPCLTVRENTERPVTVSKGSNTLVGQDLDMLEDELTKICEGVGKVGGIPDLWDGNAGERAAIAISKLLEFKK